MISTFLFLMLITSIAGSLVPFEDCGSLYYLESIEIAECSGYPCHLRIGSSVEVTVTLRIQGVEFDSEKFVQNVYLEVSYILMEVPVTPDPCGAVKSLSHKSCNLRKGDRIRYQAALNIQNVPPLPAKLYWSIRDSESNQLVVCYRLSVVLTNGNGTIILGVEKEN